jgi:hypothetical protein
MQSSPEPIKKSRKRFLQYDKYNFSMYNIWIKEFDDTHKILISYLGEDIQNYYKRMEKEFFDWFNETKNKSKFMFEIKKEFMAIADDVLLHILLQYQLKKTENCFMIGPFQKYLEIIANEDTDINLDLYDNIDMEIDSHPDIEPSYHLLEENNDKIAMEEENYVDDKSYVDDKYYKSFFV